MNSLLNLFKSEIESSGGIGPLLKAVELELCNDKPVNSQDLCNQQFISANWDKLTIKEMSATLDLTFYQIKKIADELGIGYKTPVCDRISRPNTCLILDTVTGIFYYKFREASNAFGVCENRLNKVLRKRKRYKSLLLLE
jgi:hypothetical protein